MTTPEPSPPKRRRRGLRRMIGAVLLLLALIAAVAVYSARRVIAREALTGWLKNQGVESQVVFQAFDPSGLAGSLKIGPANDPDFTAEVAEIRYDISGFWSPRPLSARVTSVRLLNPTLKARWHDGKLSFGALDPLVEKLRRRPPEPNQSLPFVAVEGGRLKLTTDYGLIDVQADASLDDGRLQRIDARFAPAVLKGPGLDARLGASELHVVAFGDRLAIAAAGKADYLRAQGVDVSAGSLRLTAGAPYPDLKRRRVDGETTLSLAFDAKGLSREGLRFRALSDTLTFKGDVAGGLRRLRLKGAGDATLQAAEALQDGRVAHDLSVGLKATDLVWDHAKTDRLSADLKLKTAAQSLSAGPGASVTRVSGVFDGSAVLDGRSYRADLAGKVSAHGGWSGLGPVKPEDAPGDAGLKRALASFLLDAPQVSIHAASDGVSLGLSQPALLRPDSGGQIVIAAADAPLFADGAGAFRLTASGGELPSADLLVSRYQLIPGGLEGQAHLAAKGSFGPVVDGSVDVAGGFRIAGGGVNLTTQACAPFTAARLELGANDVEALSGELCPGTGPLLQAADGAWRVHGLVRTLGARVPFLDAKISQASGPLELGARQGVLDLTADLRTARIEDTAKVQRFRPLMARGQAALADQVWRGAFHLADTAGRPLALASLTHDGRTGVGGVDLDTGELTFVEGGLQPRAISPIATAIGSPATGQARFQGRVEWTPTGSASRGAVDVLRLDFQSPAGAVKGLSGRVVLDSLVPLRAKPGQVLHAESLAGFAPITSGEISFGLDHDAIQVAGASFAMGGGKVTVRPFEIPFANAGTWHGEVDFERVQLSDLVEASSFSDRLALNAKVSGHVPFSVTPDGIRVTGGELHAVDNGRLSIRKDALTAVTSDGGPAPAPAEIPANTLDAANNIYSDFALQAMEDLAFSELSASIESRPDGRLGVIFHIKGEHRPLIPQQIRLTLREVLSRNIKRPLPLPSGTKVNLTLDTSLNLDQLLADFADFQRLRGSGPVQP